MGKIVEKTKKKKKGRPSLLDLQKRSLKQQQQQQNQKHPQQQKPPQQFSKPQNNNKKNNKTHKKKIQNPSPNSNSNNSSLRRSTRRNPNPNSSDDDENDIRREKNINSVLKLPHQDGVIRSNDDNSGDDDLGSSGSVLRKRKFGSIGAGSGFIDDDKDERHSVSANQASIQQGSKLDDGPSTPLPDKKLLLFILDRLQKKDTYGVFADPVDPEELPDYHEVIDNPMDFSTVRKKLGDSAYANLEQFEKDIFLICANAMQYNAPDTIYFRQARSIQELAKKDFDNLRQDSDDNEPVPDPEPKVVRRGRPPTKNLKRPPGRSPLERANSNFSEATLATAGGNTNRSNNDVRKGSPLLEKHGSADSFARSLYGSAYIGWSPERYDRSDDVIGSALKGISVKHGKKHVLDESRRNTYRQSYALGCRQEPSILSTFDGERKQLIPVGLHTEYGYARSLSRFAAKLGPVAWKVASRKIERCLASGVKFGPGWIGESDAPAERAMQQQLPAAAEQPSPPASLSTHGDSSSAHTQGIVESNGDRSAQKPEGEQLSEAATSSAQPKLDDGSSKALCPSAAGNDAAPVSSPIIPSNSGGPKLTPEARASHYPHTASNVLNSSTGAMKSGHPYQIHQSSNNQPRINGLNGSYGLNFAAQMGKMIAAARPTVMNLHSNPPIVTVSRTEPHSPCPPSGDSNGCGETKSSENTSSIKPSDSLPNAGPHPKAGSAPPDLNVGFQSPGSPGSGRADSVQPDLALQL